MSAFSKFMEALKQATSLERPAEPREISQWSENQQIKTSQLAEMMTYTEQVVPLAIGTHDALPSSSVAKKLSRRNDEQAMPSGNGITYQKGEPGHFGTGVSASRTMPSTTSPTFAGEPPSLTPRLPARVSLDDLFSDVEDDDDENTTSNGSSLNSDSSISIYAGEETFTLNENKEGEGTSWTHPVTVATIAHGNDDRFGIPLSPPPGAESGGRGEDEEEEEEEEEEETTPRPYDPKAPDQFYQDIKIPFQANTFGSPQLSLRTPFSSTFQLQRPHAQAQQPLHGPQTQVEAEAQSKHPALDPRTAKLNESAQIAHFGDKAFRKALREVEPSLSRREQYHAWRSACQEAADAACAEAGEQGGGVSRDEFENDNEMEDVDVDEQEADEASVQPSKIDDKRVQKINANSWSDAKSWTKASIRAQIGTTEDGQNKDQWMEGVSNSSSSIHQSTGACPDPEHFHTVSIQHRPQNTSSDPLFSFNQAILELHQPTVTRFTREGSAEDIHIRRLQELSQRRVWSIDPPDFSTVINTHGDKHATTGHTESGVVQPSPTSNSAGKREGTPDSMQGRQGSPPPSAVEWPSLGTNSSPACPQLQHNGVTSEGAPSFFQERRQRQQQRDKIQGGEDEAEADGAGGKIWNVNSPDEADVREHFDHHDEYVAAKERARAEFGAEWERVRQIPGLGQLDQTPDLPPQAKEEVSRTGATPSPSPPPQPPRTVLGTDADFDIRKSIEPETPRHLRTRQRDSTPAFEDRSSTPSPVSITQNHVDESRGGSDMDTEMEEVSPAHDPGTQDHVAEINTTWITEDPRYHHDIPVPSAETASTVLSPDTPMADSMQQQQRPNSTAGAAAYPPHNTSTSTPTLTTKTIKPSKQRSAGKARRKSAVQGSGVIKSAPRSRNVTRKITMSGGVAAAAASNKNEAVEKMKKEVNSVAAVPVGLEEGKVKEAVQRIEASVRRMESRGGKVPAVGTRRSRRLMEKRNGGTPEPEPE